MVAVTELVDRLSMIKLLDAAIGPIKARDRGHSGGHGPSPMDLPHRRGGHRPAQVRLALRRRTVVFAVGHGSCFRLAGFSSTRSDVPRGRTQLGL